MTISNSCDKAGTLLAHAQSLAEDLPSALKSSIFSNYAAFFERLSDDKSAQQYLEKAVVVEN